MTSALLKTIHGSHLYGLAHADSDLDYYIVVPNWRRARRNDVSHTVAGNVDVTIIGLSTWLHFCEEGVPQALEALFAQNPLYDGMAAYRANYRVNPDTLRRTYMRTVKNFIHSDSRKRRRHALRLLLNMETALQYGRFNPTLDKGQIRWLEFNTDTFGLDMVENWHRLGPLIAPIRDPCTP